MADMIHPMHPLMHAATDLVLQAHRPKLKQGAVLVDPNDDSTDPKVLFMDIQSQIAAHNTQTDDPIG